MYDPSYYRASITRARAVLTTWQTSMSFALVVRGQGCSTTMNDEMSSTWKVEAPTIMAENHCRTLVEVPFDVPPVKFRGGKDC
jgi:hypothetical protein